MAIVWWYLLVTRSFAKGYLGMLTQNQEQEIRIIVNQSLDKAEEHWKKGGHQLAVALEHATFSESVLDKSESEPSKIPGHPKVQDNYTVIDEFIALVADMRDSSKHLINAISKKTSKVTGLERVYYETSALLPAIAQTIKYKDGNVTEYLGDGVLALFKVDSDKKSDAIYSSYNAARNIIGDTREIVNQELSERYSLPPINLGVGLSLSKTLVSLVGLEGEKHPKAFGECVFRATKLSTGKNIIITDKYLKKMWPSSDGGTIKFKEKRVKKVKGFLIEDK
ncbi:hypothetical protein [uncultured Cocleimonas sp.]|uniref:hypothetical protein n=1 Tax=uncultured Cocleimonas sp. TaxID=1051587 RepID=UPI002612875B|nr:hypothetical protein [uncultured Cocleimonas sp.]